MLVVGVSGCRQGGEQRVNELKKNGVRIVLFTHWDDWGDFLNLGGDNNRLECFSQFPREVGGQLRVVGRLVSVSAMKEVAERTAQKDWSCYLLCGVVRVVFIHLL